MKITIGVIFCVGIIATTAAPLDRNEAQSKETADSIAQPSTKEEEEAVSTTTELAETESNHDQLFKLLHRLRRASGTHSKYIDWDDYYDNQDYAGYDRRGSDVGYANRDDDFPTVVW